MAEKKYTIGKGALYFKPDRDDPNNPGTQIEGISYQFLGNCPAFNTNLEIEKLDHFSSTSGIQVKDMSIVTRTGVMANFTLDEPKAEILKLFLMASATSSRDQAVQATNIPVGGEYDVLNNRGHAVTIGALGDMIPLYVQASQTPGYGSVTQTVGTGTAMTLSTPSALVYTSGHDIEVEYDAGNTIIVTIDGVAATNSPFTLTGAGPYIYLFNGTDADGLLEGLQMNWATAGTDGDKFTFSTTITGTALRVHDLNSTNKPVVTNLTGTVTYVEGASANYTVDYAAGALKINADQSGAVAAMTAGQTLLVTSRWAALDTIQTNDAFTTTSIKGHLYFIGNPPQGEAIDVKGYVSLTPTGDLALISEEWAQVQFEAEFLEHTRYPGLVQATNRTEVG